MSDDMTRETIADTALILAHIRWIANIESAAGLGTFEEIRDRVVGDARRNPERVAAVANALRVGGPAATAPSQPRK